MPYETYRPDLKDIPGHPHPLQRIGAPKLFFDQSSRRFLLTWHTPNLDGSPQDPERYRGSQRTLYVRSPDLRRFAGAWRRLFGWDRATIDTIIQPNDEGWLLCHFERRALPLLCVDDGKDGKDQLRRQPARPLPASRPPDQPQFP
jgi:hypothetical protein